MFLDEEPEDDAPRFDSYDLKWVIVYAFIAWAAIMGLTLPALLL